MGGAIVELLTTDLGAPSIRATQDVDLICKAVIRSDFYRVEEELRRQGFVHDVSPKAPICRWRVNAVAVDVMPTLENILGFSNPWYPLGLETAVRVVLPSGREIKCITAPVFLATKLQAFNAVATAIICRVMIWGISLPSLMVEARYSKNAVKAQKS